MIFKQPRKDVSAYNSLTFFFLGEIGEEITSLKCPRDLGQWLSL